MKTMIKWQLPVLAATLLVAACDPFPAKPGGDPSVVLVTTNGLVSQTVEHAAGDAAGKVTVATAYPDDVIYILFNKPMTGSTIQKSLDGDPSIPLDLTTVGIFDDPGYAGDPTATPPKPARPAVVDPGIKFPACLPAANLTLAGFGSTPAVKQTYTADLSDILIHGSYTVYTTVCDMPSAPTNGGQAVVTPGAPMFLGVDYKVGGTATDYQGSVLPLDVTVQVTPELFATPFADGYRITLSWFERETPGAYTLSAAADVNGVAGTYVPLDLTTTPPACAKVPNPKKGITTGCTWQHLELQPKSTHWYTLTEAGFGARGGEVSAKTGSGRAVTVATTATTATPPVVVKGKLRATWSAITGANGYVLERSDTSVTPAVWTTVWTTTWTGVGTDVDGSAHRNFVDGASAQPDPSPATAGTLVSTTKYSYRVHPTFADGVVVAAGPASAAKAVP